MRTWRANGIERTLLTFSEKGRHATPCRATGDALGLGRRKKQKQGEAKAKAIIMVSWERKTGQSIWF